MFEDYQPYDDCEPAGVELPKIRLPEGQDSYEFLKDLTRHGLRKKGITKWGNRQEYYDRALQELETFEELGFTDYVLLNWDILNFCRENNIPVGAGRGSAAGSLVLYLLGVTDVDPIKHSLFFERFVSKSRAKKITDKHGKTFLVGDLLPDVDSDISYEHRSKVIEYIEEQHKGKTSKILTFNTLTSRLCIREAAKYFEDASEEEIGRISDMIPELHGQIFSLTKSYEENEKFRKWADEHKETYKYALSVENLNKNHGVHPSGIAICSQAIENVIPLQKTKDGELVSGYDMNDVSALMVKFDILGLKTLSVVYRTCQKLGIKMEDIDPQDPFIYQAFKELDFPQGLFQISAYTNFKVCRQIKPDNIDELSDVLALARPGALDFVDSYIENKNEFSPIGLNDELDSILSWSKNVILYQEQLMQIAHNVFGFSLEEAEILRRIVGKKKVNEMPAWREKIFNAAKQKNLDVKVAEYYWKALEDSANYSFNKSHSMSYAYLAARTVYLKYKYPQEFYVSVLEIAKYKQDPLQFIGEVSQEMRAFGIKLLPPSLVKSNMDFTIDGDHIRYGLDSIKGVAEKSFQNLIDFRDSGQCENKFDLFLTAKSCKLNIGILSSLIMAGCIDDYTNSRCDLVLEAQLFNLLTEREVRNIVKIGWRYDYNLLALIKDVVSAEVVGDDNRKIMSPKRYKTFYSKAEKYLALHKANKKHEKFAYWWFEYNLLGYSYSFKLKDCFIDEYGTIIDLAELSDCNGSFTTIGCISDFFIRTSREKGNRYMNVTLLDETKTERFIFADSQRGNKFSEWAEENKLKKKDIAIIVGSRNRESNFVNNIVIVDTNTYMNIREL